VAYVELEALDISNIHDPSAEEALAKQIVSFINKNGTPSNTVLSLSATG
jgi:hypothetical protein